ncbi:helix-turn-helix domain-containing protein [Jiangella alkaliphila]|uniref:Helix-turn-helix domain-containing protein n=1 Tax=Jiangella alkaliphila TaxID=419479 RepID=A0A1H2G170_9ACTN|nr:helix-turn-helix domain-containing protein [Jiangella alkaliphila]SDU13332.1 Helix-turn-helix domain-containing protein [Jiangella alkaliphila]
MASNPTDRTPRTADGRPWVVYDPDEAKRSIGPAALSEARAQLDTEIAAYQLTEIRKAQGRTQTQVAADMGVSQKRISAIESGDLMKTEVDTVARYVEALGGRVRVVADFPEGSVTIR